MVEEVLALLGAAPGGLLVDGTVGQGGHSALWLAGDEGRTVIGIDRDGEMLERAKARLSPYAGRFRLVKGTFAETRRILDELDEDLCDAALLDLGVNSAHLDEKERGFSFDGGPLDSRFDREEERTLAALLARIPEVQLADALFHLGGERHSRRIARAIVNQRNRTPLRDAAQLADLVARSLPRRRGGRPRIHPATRTFQALRMLLNDEMGHLERGLPEVVGCIRPGGRLAVISFHSGEDGRVKRAFKEEKKSGRGNILTKKPLMATEEETRRNPRARSARLRGLEIAATGASE
ncbi:MAG: 16S rRNA (cytosine(1402)-N(4))-methyltransferase RsmH [Planctomycetota bacterium]|jgi:16S rRNA (cytosine1402-N4)-methyltransferase